MGITRLQREHYLRKSVRRAQIDMPTDPVETHVFVPFRCNALRGALADHILRRQHGDIPRQSVLAALVPSLAGKALGVVRRYRDRYAPELRWVLLDQNGNGRAQLGSDETTISVRAIDAGHKTTTRTSATLAGASVPRNLFTPNNQWLLKVLLLSDIDERFWGGPKLPADAGVGDLAEVAQVPQSSVSRFVGLAEGRGFLKRRRRTLVPQRLPALLEHWAHYLHNHPDPMVPVRLTQPSTGTHQELAALINSDLVLGGQWAVAQLGLSTSEGNRAILYCRDSDHALVVHGLAECCPTDSTLQLCEPLAKSAVFDGSRQDYPCRIADVLQLYLEAKASGCREEEAEQIYEKALEPAFRKKRWL